MPKLGLIERRHLDRKASSVRSSSKVDWTHVVRNVFERNPNC
jgi:hypothetical protein